MEKIQYGKLYSFSLKNLKIKLARSVKKIVASTKVLVKNAVSFLHEKLSKAEDYTLTKIDKAGDWAFEKLEERD